MNHSHPLDLEVDQMADTRKALHRIFARDGVICAEEDAVLMRFDDHYTDLSGYRRRQVAAECFERNGVTRHTRRQFEDAGAELIDLAAERRQRRPNVITFTTRDSNDAA